jgi:aminodeoxyfutalosine synthase
MSEDVTAAAQMAVQKVVQKVADGVTLSEADWARLTGSHDLIALGMAADTARRRRHDDRVTFVQVLEVPLDPRDPLDSDALEAPIPPPTGEVRVTGCPDSSAAAVAAVRTTVARAGAVPVTGFALADLEDVAGHDRSRLRDVLGALREAGLAQLGEVSAAGLTDPDGALAALRDSGVQAARVTLGVATGDAALTLIRQVASWDGVGDVCRCLAPLPRTGSSPPSTGYADLRQVALARLLVDNIDSIQVDWSRYGPKLAQVALTFGADDVDGVPVTGADDQGWRRSPGEEIRRNIVGAGFTAVPRDGRFEVMEDSAESHGYRTRQS